ncbi:MAG TPA: hypothetical protein VGR28_14835 [Candidatus Thermoplasmatota archaeon]|nr:hypothetical protein [Candidatus Thermoplasmatota archaeon]
MSRDHGYHGPPWYPPHRCMWCGIALEDPGAGFIDHAKANPDCFVQWQDFRNNMKREAGGT